ncbi:riboflavin biosynthesis protein [Chlorobiota bacterium]|nr:riboflavin biosynthesis protein [Chlorobiota bacterium]
MIVYSLFDAIPFDPNTILTVGTFDGVHRGHQYIIAAMNELKKSRTNARTVVVTFEPHPQLVIQRPDKPPITLLTDISERLQLLESYGVDIVVIIPFTKEFSQISSNEFIKTFIQDRIGCSDIFIGYDHGFGKSREGDARTLHALSSELGFTVHEVDAMLMDSTTISSTEIRSSLKKGNLQVAFELLGHPYFVEGMVIHGDQRGRTIGYPTANIQAANPAKLLPKNGVYFVSSDILGKTVYGMANIGTRPTVTNLDDIKFEVHFFDLNEDLYHQQIVIWFLKFIRDEQQFASIESLQEQLHIDEQYCRDIISTLQGNDTQS